MKMFLPRLLKSLKSGHYMIRVNQYRNGQALPITERERREFERIAEMHAGEGKHPKGFEPGQYLIEMDRYGNAINIVGMNVAESHAFIQDVIGRF